MQCVDHTLRLQLTKDGSELGLLALALGMAKTRQQDPTIEHDAGICRKHHIRQTGDAVHRADAATKLLKRIAQRGEAGTRP